MTAAVASCGSSQSISNSSSSHSLMKNCIRNLRSLNTNPHKNKVIFIRALEYPYNYKTRTFAYSLMPGRERDLLFSSARLVWFWDVFCAYFFKSRDISWSHSMLYINSVIFISLPNPFLSNLRIRRCDHFITFKCQVCQILHSGLYLGICLPCWTTVLNLRPESLLAKTIPLCPCSFMSTACMLLLTLLILSCTLLLVLGDPHSSTLFSNPILAEDRIFYQMYPVCWHIQKCAP